VIRPLIGLVVLLVLLGTVAFSRPGQDNPLTLKKEARNPWTRLEVNSDPAEFQFAIVSDRTGGHRAQVFSRAVARLNLLQPEFVVCVGDLIEGGGGKSDKALDAEWAEFDGYVKQLQMPFFYLPGNHDVGSRKTDALWQKKFGRRHYHFVYRNTLFLCLNTEDPPGSGRGHLSKGQVDYALKALRDNPRVRWTVVLMHKPIWTAADLQASGWQAVEKALADRPYTVFVGHIHVYRKFVRQGRSYYQLATTGGGSRMRGVAAGEFDHIVWVTMKKSGPVLANVLLDGVLPDDLATPASDEKGVPTRRQPLPTAPVTGFVYADGGPVVGAMVTFTSVADENARRRSRGDATTDADGSFTVSTYKNNDGLPPGKYRVSVVRRTPFRGPDGRPGPNSLPEKYASPRSSPLVVTIPEKGAELKLDLER
jgi:3',5'-cyclic AMP phosphodiesterase CpdA